MKRTLNLALLASSAILFLNLLGRLVDESKLLQYFPLDYVNDVSSYMAQLHFLKVCGFHNFCPYWYNGFTAFSHTPPGWFFLASPFYHIFGDVKATTYFMMILEVSMAFILIFYFGKFLGLSRLKRIALFAFLFGNAIAIGGFIRLGRLHELLGWLFFIALFMLVFHYCKRNLDGKFMVLFFLLFAAIVLTYQSIAIFALFLTTGLLLARAGEWYKIAASLGGAALITCFWWLPFIRSLSGTDMITKFLEGKWILNFHDPRFSLTLAASFAIPILMLVTFALFWTTRNKSRQELFLFAPMLALCALFLLRLTAFIPVLNYIFPDPYLFLFMFFSAFFFLKSNCRKLKPVLVCVLAVLVVSAALSSVYISKTHTPAFVVPDGFAIEVLDALEESSGSFFILGKNIPNSAYDKAYYAYAPVYLNLTTPQGWYPELTSSAHLSELDELMDAFNAENCPKLIKKIASLRINNIITDKPGCESFQKCGLVPIRKTNNTCTVSVAGETA